MALEKCPGTYCGRVDLGNNTFSDCMACPRGFRVQPDNDYICMPCEQPLTTYDWYYLGFMTILPLIFHFFCINSSAKKRTFTKEEIILHVSAFVEVGLAAFLTILLTEPKWSLQIHSCGVKYLSDFYTLFHNPNPNYEEILVCTQEAVYPLQTMILIFYLFCVTLMMIIRPSLNARYLPKNGKMAVYYALYIFPILSVLHAVAGGLIYYSFPFLSIFLSVVSNALHFSIKLDQSVKSLIITSVTEIRNVIIIIGHWIILAYGIISYEHMLLLVLVPVPSLFYILTARFTHPDNFK